MIQNADNILKLQIGGFSLLTYFTSITISPIFALPPFLGLLSKILIVDVALKYKLGNNLF